MTTNELHEMAIKISNDYAVMIAENEYKSDKDSIKMDIKRHEKNM